MAPVSLCMYVFVMVAICTSQAKTGTDRRNGQRHKIPLEIVLKLHTIEDENQLMQEFFSNDGETQPKDAAVHDVSFRLASAPFSTPKVKSIPEARNAICTPELRAVRIPQPEDPGTIHWPTCTRLGRCGGCCGEPFMCEAVLTSPVNFTVRVLEYNGMALVNKNQHVIMVTLYNHTKCKCECATKEKDCTAAQVYRQNECRCVCRDPETERMCIAGDDSHHWDSHTCSCRCRHVFECTTGSFFSNTTCRCEADRQRDLFGNQQHYSRLQHAHQPHTVNNKQHINQQYVRNRHIISEQYGRRHQHTRNIEHPSNQVQRRTIF